MRYINTLGLLFSDKNEFLMRQMILSADLHAFSFLQRMMNDMLPSKTKV